MPQCLKFKLIQFKCDENWIRMASTQRLLGILAQNLNSIHLTRVHAVAAEL